MGTEKATFSHRNGQRPENNLGVNKQTTTCPYCSKTYSATDELLMRLELLTHQGTRNMEKYLKLQTEDALKERWIETLLIEVLKNEGEHARTPPAKQEISISIPINRKTGHQRPTSTERKGENSNATKTHRKNRRPTRTSNREETLKPHGRKPPETTTTQPIIPLPDQQTKKMMKSSQNNQRYGNDTHKK